MEAAQEHLFDPHDFTDHQRLRELLVLADQELPFLPGVSDRPVPDFNVWHDSGVPFMARTHQDVATALLGCSEDEITPEAFVSKFDEFIEEQRWGYAADMAVAAKEITGAKVWEEKLLIAEIAILHLGLQEASNFKSRRPDDLYSADIYEEESPPPQSPLTPKKFIALYHGAHALAEKYPEALAPYMAVADELFLEMALYSPEKYDLHHQFGMRFGHAADDPAIAGIAERIKNRDPEWRQRASDAFQDKVQVQLQTEYFANTTQLFWLGRLTDLLSAEFVRYQFVRKYDQLDLMRELPEHVIQINSMFPSFEQPKLTRVQGLIFSLSLVDDPLARDLEAFSASRDIETAQSLLRQPANLEPGLANLLKSEIHDLIGRLLDEDSRKAVLWKQRLAETQASLLQGERPQGIIADRVVEDHMQALVKGHITNDELFIALDELFHNAIARLDFHPDEAKVEYLAALISPLARVSEGVLKTFFTKELQAKAAKQLHSAHYSIWMQRSKEAGQDYRELAEAMERSPYEFFSLYWHKFEEYYG